MTLAHWGLKKIIKLALVGTFVCALYQLPTLTMESKPATLPQSSSHDDSDEGSIPLASIPTNPIPSYPPEITGVSNFIEQEIDAFTQKHKAYLDTCTYNYKKCYKNDAFFLLTPQDAPVLHSLFVHLWAKYASHIQQTNPPLFLCPNSKSFAGEIFEYDNMSIITSPEPIVINIGEKYVHRLKNDVLIESALVHEIGHAISHQAIDAQIEKSTHSKHWYNKYWRRHVWRRDEQMADRLSIEHNPNTTLQVCERERGFPHTKRENLIGHLKSYVCPKFPLFDLGFFSKRRHPSDSARITNALAYKYYIERQRHRQNARTSHVAPDGKHRHS
jgi:hypothetical protein